jgi:predicted dehydrogenase
MRLLIFGLSSIAARRLLPAVDAADAISAVDLGTSKDGSSRPALTCKKLGTIYPSYDEALRSSTAELVYVSLVNSFHELWTERGLEQGKHVIVDKPAFLSFRSAEKLCAAAGRAGLCLAEALVYPYHPQIERIRLAFRDAGDRPLRISAALSFPPLGAGNFRYQESLGGGALWDLGPYAASVGRIFFEDVPEDVFCRVNGRLKDVDVSFSSVLSYSGARSVAMHCGFDTQYENRITVTGAKLSVTAERVFTTPADYRGELAVVHPGGTERRPVTAADTFARFLEDVAAAANSGDHARFTKALLQDAAVLETMRQSAGVKHAY